VVYRYTVNGKQYTADRFFFIGSSYSTHEAAFRVTQAYAVGADVPAYYDPRDPSVAVLDRSSFDVTLLNGATIVVWGTMIGICLYALFRWRRQIDRQRATANWTWAMGGQREAH